MTRMSPSRRRCLELLAQAPEGVTEPLLRVEFGIDTPVTAGLVEEGLAVAREMRQRVGNRVLEVQRVQITDAGRRALR